MNSEQIVAREGVLRQMLGHHHEVLGDADWPLLEPILLGDPSTRTDLVVRIARRSQIAWKEEGGAARLHDVGDLLDLDRLLMVAAIASTLKEENPQYRIYAEVVVNLQHLLRRYLMQRLLFDTDVSVALYAVKSLEGGVTPAQFQTAFTFLAGSDAARTDQLSATLVGDLFDASLWRSSPSARDFGVKRRAFQLAWRSSSLGAMRYEIGQLGGASDVTKNFVADFDGAGVLSLCLRDGVRTGYPGVTKWCISDEQFESRSNYRAPDDVQTVRFWVGVLGARESVRSGAGAGMGSGATNGSDFTPP